MVPIVCNPREALAITTPDGTKIVIRFEAIVGDQARVKVEAPRSHIVLMDATKKTNS